jgi:hypothetical protein
VRTAAPPPGRWRATAPGLISTLAAAVAAALRHFTILADMGQLN